MAYLTDLDEIPKDKPTHWYKKELERTRSMLLRHTEWTDYCKKKIEIFKDILIERGVDVNAEFTKSDKTA